MLGGNGQALGTRRRLGLQKGEPKRHPLELRQRPRKPAPERVLKSWAEQWRHEGVEVDWKRLLPPKGYQVLPRRWVVERTFSWIDHNRRMSKDYERLPETSEAFIYVAMSRLMVRRLAQIGRASCRERV